MKRILVLGQMKDFQTGMYIVETIEELGHEASFVDTRMLAEEGIVEAQDKIIEALYEQKEPNLIIVLKGLEMTYETIKTIKEKFPKATLTNWFFDVFLADRRIWDNISYHKTLKLYDYFMCSLKGVAEVLNERGFNNVIHIPEACFPQLHGEQYMNNFQKQKYANDVTFIGSVGMLGIHKNRAQYLERIVKEGFHLKIYGDMVGESKSISLSVRHVMTNKPVINEEHSIIVQSSLINLGLDQDPTLNESWSARLYRIMCAGGLYLSVATKGLSNHFKINKEGEEITKDQDLVIFYSYNDLVTKLDFLLEHDEIRKSIAKNGQKIVLEKHTFKHRINEIIKIVKGE